MKAWKSLAILFFVGSLRGVPLDLPLSARIGAMGGAFTGVARDGATAPYNPAGLALLTRSQVSITHWIFQEIPDLMIDYVSFGYPLALETRRLGVGFAWERRGSRLENFFGETSSMSEHTFSLTLSAKPTRMLAVGINLNRFMLLSTLGSKSGWGFDLGLHVRPRRWMGLGFTARNIAAGYGEEQFPTTLRAGLAFFLFPSSYTVLDTVVRKGKRVLVRRVRTGEERVILAVDLRTKENVNGKEGVNLLYHVGLEIRWIPQLALRVGSSSNVPLSAGVGIYYRGIGVDYAFESGNPWLGDQHKIGLSYAF